MSLLTGHYQTQATKSPLVCGRNGGDNSSGTHIFDARAYQSLNDSEVFFGPPYRGPMHVPLTFDAAEGTCIPPSVVKRPVQSMYLSFSGFDSQESSNDLSQRANVSRFADLSIPEKPGERDDRAMATEKLPQTMTICEPRPASLPTIEQ